MRVKGGGDRVGAGKVRGVAGGKKGGGGQGGWVCVFVSTARPLLA